jgi:hypothetical protein
VLDERLTRLAELALVGPLGHPVRPLDLLQVRLRVVGLDPPKERVDPIERVIAGAQAREEPTSPIHANLLRCLHAALLPLEEV